MIRGTASAFPIAIALWLAPAALGAGQTVPLGLKACVAEKDDTQRLACFDRELARLSEPSTAATPAPAAAPATPALTAEERFGRRGELVREDKEKRDKNGPKIEELVAVVTKISARSLGELVITLDNGQVWTQTAVDSHFSVKVNDKVMIKAGVLGSFFLVAPAKRSTQVRRLR